MTIVGLRFDESVVGAPFDHNQALILLSVLVAAIAIYAALELAERLRGAGTAAPIWHAASSIALGGGLWAMHAIAMLGFDTPVARGYDLGLAALSAFAAVAGAAVAFWIIRASVVRGRVGWLHLACAGAVLGLGLSAMLYTGVAALRVSGETVYRPSLFSLSVATSIAASIAMLWFAVLRTLWWQRALAAVAIAAAFCGLHYSAAAGAAIVAGEATTTSDAIVASAPIIAGWIALVAVGGVIIALVGAFYDRRHEKDAAHEAVRLRKEVAKRTVELQSSADQLDAALVAAERASAAKSDFLAGLSHELRTPLNSILGFSQLLMNGRSFEPLSPKHMAAVQQIDQAGRHLVLLIDDILDLSRIEAGRLPLAVESVEAAALIDEAASMLQPSAIAANVTLHTDAAFRGLFVRADRRRLLQVLINLLSNGIKYNRQGGSVSVSCREVDSEARISVSDTGAGIPAHRLDEVFEPFNRLGQDSSTITGSGVGLALCRRLIESMRGAIRVNSVEGKGSTFTVTLPLAAQTEWVEPTPPRATVLYVEDNPANVLLMRHIMKEMSGVELVVATTPREGIELARGLRPGLVLLDINLPDMDGYEVLRALRADTHTTDIPVFAVTSNALSKELERGVAAGFDHYLTKPLNIPQFVAAVEVALTQPPSRRPKRVRIKPPVAPGPARVEALAVKPPTVTPARKPSILTSLFSPSRVMATPSPEVETAPNIPPDRGVGLPATRNEA